MTHFLGCTACLIRDLLQANSLALFIQRLQFQLAQSWTNVKMRRPFVRIWGVNLSLCFLSILTDHFRAHKDKSPPHRATEKDVLWYWNASFLWGNFTEAVLGYRTLRLGVAGLQATLGRLYEVWHGDRTLFYISHRTCCLMWKCFCINWRNALWLVAIHIWDLHWQPIAIWCVLEI